MFIYNDIHKNSIVDVYKYNTVIAETVSKIK